jgi:hypothetical protein
LEKRIGAEKALVKIHEKAIAFSKLCIFLFLLRKEMVQSLSKP